MKTECHRPMIRNLNPFDIQIFRGLNPGSDSTKFAWIFGLLGLCFLSLFFTSCSDKGKPFNPNVRKPGWVLKDTSKTQDTLLIANLNMSVGFEVQQLLLADLSVEENVYTRATQLLVDFKSSLPNQRVRLMAELIAAENPDVIGLQEVTVIYEFDSLLIDFHLELIRLVDSISMESRYFSHRVNLNNIPFTAKSTSGDSIRARFIEGNSILYRKDYSEVDTSRQMLSKLIGPIPLMATTIYSERALATLRFKTVAGKRYQLDNTHFETLSSFSKPQANEALKIMNSREEVDVTQIFLGDMNAKPSEGADTIIKAGGFIDTYQEKGDASKGGTCCIAAGKLVLSADSVSVFSQRIDYIYARSIVEVLDSRVALDNYQQVKGGSYAHPSDHGMVISRIVSQH